MSTANAVATEAREPTACCKRSNTEIAGELHVAESTVKTHVVHILEKLALRDRTQSAVVADESGLVRPGEN